MRSGGPHLRKTRYPLSRAPWWHTTSDQPSLLRSSSTESSLKAWSESTEICTSIMDRSLVKTFRMSSTRSSWPPDAARALPISSTVGGCFLLCVLRPAGEAERSSAPSPLQPSQSDNSHSGSGRSTSWTFLGIFRSSSSCWAPCEPAPFANSTSHEVAPGAARSCGLRAAGVALPSALPRCLGRGLAHGSSAAAGAQETGREAPLVGADCLTCVRISSSNVPLLLLPRFGGGRAGRGARSCRAPLRSVVDAQQAFLGLWPAPASLGSEAATGLGQDA
mmetsp:Transcript_10315/g.30263  ORF Transcript_10315/g.30263 Transcript_10315/m.30263 type:complete len:277 (+) Transcript_10315:408-1238(+)